MKISLPDQTGRMADYRLTGTPVAAAVLGANPARVVYSAAHVVADPFTAHDPAGRPAVDWDKTMEFRRYGGGGGRGLAEGRAPARRGGGRGGGGGGGLPGRPRAELPDALVANG